MAMYGAEWLISVPAYSLTTLDIAVPLLNNVKQPSQGVYLLLSLNDSYLEFFHDSEHHPGRDFPELVPKPEKLILCIHVVLLKQHAPRRLCQGPPYFVESPTPFVSQSFCL